MKHRLTGIYWIKNESRYLPEYIEFHLLQGFDHFIFYDNGSTDRTKEILQPYIDDQIVELRYYPKLDPNVSKNFWIASTCCNELKNISEWIHFHAIDERIFCPDGSKVIDLLERYKNYGGLSVAWKEFNSNGLINRKDGLIIENFTTTCIDTQCHIKTIVQPINAIGFAYNPHNFLYLNNKFSVDENFNRIDGPFNPSNYSSNLIRNHHYRTLSKEEFEIKMDKGCLDRPEQEDIRREQAQDEWNWCHGLNSRWGITTLSSDKTLLSYVPIVREKIMNRYYNKKHLLEYINN